MADETALPAQENVPKRPLRRNSKDASVEVLNKLAKSGSGVSAGNASMMSSLAGDHWHSVRSTRSTTDDDQTLHTCADETLVDSEDLRSMSDTLNDPRDLGSDDEFSLEMLPRDRNSRHLE